MKYPMLALIGVLSATTAQAKAVKLIDPLPRAALGTARVIGVDITVNDVARPTFDALEKKAAEKKEGATAAAGASSPADAYADLPFARMFPLVINDELKGWHLSGTRPVTLDVQLDALKTADGAAMILLGSVDELAGLVTVKDAGSGEMLGDFYVDVLNVRAGLLGAALRGSGVREKLAAEFAKHVAEVLSGRKSKDSTKLTPAPDEAEAPRGKPVDYPIAADVLAKTPAEIGMTISPAPAHGTYNIMLATGSGVAHSVTGAGDMTSGVRLANDPSPLIRELVADADANGKLGDETAGVPTLHIRIDHASTLIRFVSTGELKGTDLIRVTLIGSVTQENGAARPIVLTVDRSIKGVKASHEIALVSREAVLQFITRAEAS